ncbi:MAG: hypothetical protein QOI10_3086 [Solirubrobacterales bacterium]|jgi:hypothetical protein|nr:hypothetical protein [Solirubrobacterales bacterium]
MDALRARRSRRWAARLACVLALAAAGDAAGAVQEPQPAEPVADGAVFRGDGMWIWYLSQAEGGDLARIAARAQARGVDTVYVKSGDGADVWRQFTAGMVATLEERGLNVCAWQYVYGSDPAAEARVGAVAALRGADCLVIDAESEYEGRYEQASTYIAKLRAAVGDEFPIGLAGFPYVHYHPGYPYSVFLGPGGAEFNLPQVYWQAIGTSVDRAMTTTYTFNRVYVRPIDPIGQLYDDPPRRQVRRFRQLARASGFGGTSWWSWQDASPSGFRSATKRRIGHATGYRPSTAYPTLEKGAAGDLVVWAQEYLAAAGFFDGSISGEYGILTSRGVRAFQASVGLAPTGVLDAATWPPLLASAEPGPARWGRGTGKAALPAAPRSAGLPAVEDELAR